MLQHTLALSPGDLRSRRPRAEDYRIVWVTLVRGKPAAG